MPDPTIEEAKRALSHQLMQYPQVTGVGIEGNQIMVYLAVDDPAFIGSIPTVFQGYPVKVEIIGAATPH